MAASLWRRLEIANELGTIVGLLITVYNGQHPLSPPPTPAVGESRLTCNTLFLELQGIEQLLY